MKRNIIHYIGYYTNHKNERNLYSSPACCSKMEYIVSVLKEEGYSIDVFSTSWTQKKTGHYKRKTVEIDETEKQIYISTFGASNVIQQILQRAWASVQLLWYLLFCVKKDEIVLVYHSVSYCIPLAITRWLKRFKFVLEVEELYYKVFNQQGRQKKCELQMIKGADAYLFSNDILAKNAEVEHKPFIVVYGNYYISERHVPQRNDGFIHVVYAGGIESIKQGAFMAVESAQFLSRRYKMHILGFGSNKELKKLKKYINGINDKIGEKRVKYHGYLPVRKFSNFLHSCHIGINSQTMEGEYVDNIFPSKLLVYLAHDLQTISGNVPCVANSRLAGYINFYNENTPKSIAQAIMEIDLKKKGSSLNILAELDAVFKHNIHNLLDQLSKNG